MKRKIKSVLKQCDSNEWEVWSGSILIGVVTMIEENYWVASTRENNRIGQSTNSKKNAKAKVDRLAEYYLNRMDFK